MEDHCGDIPGCLMFFGNLRTAPAAGIVHSGSGENAMPLCAWMTTEEDSPTGVQRRNGWPREYVLEFNRDPYREIYKEIPRGPTPRRLAAAKRALRRQRDKLPLFADEIAAGQPTPEERIKYFDEMHVEWLKRRRKYTASVWRRARKALREMDEAEQRRLLKFWNEDWLGPRDACYFADLVRNWDKRERRGYI